MSNLPARAIAFDPSNVPCLQEVLPPTEVDFALDCRLQTVTRSCVHDGLEGPKEQYDAGGFKESVGEQTLRVYDAFAGRYMLPDFGVVLVAQGHDVAEYASYLNSPSQSARRQAIECAGDGYNIYLEALKLSFLGDILKGSGERCALPKLVAIGNDCPHCKKLSDSRAQLLIGKHMRRRFLVGNRSVWYFGVVRQYLGFYAVSATLGKAFERQANHFRVAYNDGSPPEDIELATLLRLLTT